MTILDLYRQGHIKTMFEAGLVSSNIMLYFDYYEKFNYLRTSGHKSYNDAVFITSSEFRVSESTVKRAIRIINGSNLASLKHKQ